MKRMQKTVKKNRYSNMTPEEKQKYKKYQKNYREAKKKQRKIIDIFLKTNDKEYENFMNNINNVDIKKKLSIV